MKDFHEHFATEVDSADGCGSCRRSIFPRPLGRRHPHLPPRRRMRPARPRPPRLRPPLELTPLGRFPQSHCRLHRRRLLLRKDSASRTDRSNRRGILLRTIKHRSGIVMPSWAFGRIGGRSASRRWGTGTRRRCISLRQRFTNFIAKNMAILQSSGLRMSSTNGRRTSGIRRN